MKKILIVIAVLALLVLAAGCKLKGIETQPAESAQGELDADVSGLEADSSDVPAEDISIDTAELESLDM
ncbi:MAG TPA: hypothetical protein HA362_06595 [Nanoarchaeota archaeon]|nr:hypothetical protein [Nanoarchaeota archaeon]